MSPEPTQDRSRDPRTDGGTGAAPADAWVPAPASPTDAGALPAGRGGRRRAEAQTSGRTRRSVLLAALCALVVAGLLAYDFLHLRHSNDEPESVTVRVPEPSSAAAAPVAPSPALSPPAAATPQARAASATAASSRPTTPAGEAATSAPNPEALLAERTALLERAQAAFDEGNLDRAQSEARRAAALGNREADALLGAIAFKRGNLDEAERLIGKALQRDPDNARLARQLQVVHAKQGR